MANKNHSEKTTSKFRKEDKTAQEAGAENKKNSEEKPKREKEGRIRLIPIWLRLVIILLLAFIAMIVGAMIGYGIVGDGTNPFEIFNPETWYQIYDMIFEGTDMERD